MLTLTRDLIRAAGTDAGNRSMRAAGRTVWSAEDFNTAARECGQLDPWRGEYDEPAHWEE